MHTTTEEIDNMPVGQLVEYAKRVANRVTILEAEALVVCATMAEMAEKHRAIEREHRDYIAKSQETVKSGLTKLSVEFVKSHDEQDATIKALRAQNTELQSELAELRTKHEADVQLRANMHKVSENLATVIGMMNTLVAPK